MFYLLVCLLLAVILAYLSKAPVMMAMNQQGGYDNHHPRAQQSQLTGFGVRAVAGHQNSFEALIVFSIAVFATIVTNDVTMTIKTLATVHLIARVIYHVLYLINWSTMRSLVWFIATLCAFWMLISAVMHTIA